MLTRMPTHCDDDTCPSCVVAGDYVFLAHHAGGHDRADVAYQMRATFDALAQTLASVGATLSDLVMIHLYLKDIGDFRAAREVFREYFHDGFPARMGLATEFVSPQCLVMVDGIAYRPAPAAP